jgi:hypothetical protein
MSQFGGMELYFQIQLFYFRSGISMTQRGYVHPTLKQFSLNECKTILTPMAKNTKFSIDMDEKHVDIHLF